MVLLLWQHGEMTGIPPQVVHSYKCFNGKLNSCLKPSKQPKDELPHLECPQWPLPLVVPPPHAHDPPDMHTSWVSSHPGVGQQQELTQMMSMN